MARIRNARNWNVRASLLCTHEVLHEGCVCMVHAVAVVAVIIIELSMYFASLGHCTGNWEHQPYDLGYLVSLRFAHFSLTHLLALTRSRSRSHSPSTNVALSLSPYRNIFYCFSAQFRFVFAFASHGECDCWRAAASFA